MGFADAMPGVVLDIFVRGKREAVADDGIVPFTKLKVDGAVVDSIVPFDIAMDPFVAPSDDADDVVVSSLEVPDVESVTTDAVVDSLVDAVFTF